ncbi:Potassium voltage-gated channel subfamily H member 2 [Stylophora pistillata]|uniref:Potassium voltage-gated channel subfamily H member 2 n=1 Tax=Stylophora pistillata TaxID=50429 RepID=A0A2B4SAJ7_STYPI|nr:Potassium voltage-gated channel subfamily H member 2 [Stylophora pistillata]
MHSSDNCFGSPFWCLLDIVPIKNEKGNVVLFLASHKDITKRKISGEVPQQDVASISGGTEKLSRSRSRNFSRDVLLHLSRQYAQSAGPANKANPRSPIKRARAHSIDRKGSSFNEGFLIQLLKCGRLLRLFRVVRKLHRYTEYSAILLTLLMIAFAMMAHWLACIWYVIGLSEISENSTVSWLYALGEAINKPYVNFTAETGPDEGSAYVTALYFTLTSMTTVGFGNVAANTNGEKVFAVVTMLIGALMHAAIFGNVAAIIQKLYANRVRYHSRANEIKQFIRVHRIDQDLANRLEDYFHTTWSLSGGVDTSEILTTFPEELQSDVCMHLYKGLLELSPFNQAPRGCLKMLSPQVRTVYVGPGEVLLAQNDVINAIYYIANGSMEVLQGESVAAILGKCDDALHKCC